MRPGDGVAWITGASGGIGRALSLELARRGWTVFATARSAEALARLAAEADGLCKDGLGGSVRPMPGDVTDPAAMKAVVADIIAERPLALAVLNAGIYTPMRAQAFDASAARRMFEVNLGGVANALEPVLQAQIAQGRGHVALTASVAGYRGLPRAAGYSATKAGLIAMGEALAMDLLDLGVRISVINPGFVETEATAVNDFEMPFLIPATQAARRIADGLGRPGFEIAFPRRFALILRLVGMLPNRAYFWAVRKALGWEKMEP
ncbi:MAG: SDR family NAD(P)-dependent oxidoreductase [Pseudomonadota bacterium]